MNSPERRFLPSEAPTATGRTVSGYAARFNSRSENLGTPERPFHEIIQPGAFDSVLSDDVIACYNHDESAILARSAGGKGSLKLTVDGTGLHYEFQAPETTVGNDLLESIKRGDISASSFAFRIAENGDVITRDEATGGTLRTISKVGRLFDVSPVCRPAYQAATVSARSHNPTAPEAPAVNAWAKLFDVLR